MSGFPQKRQAERGRSWRRSGEDSRDGSGGRVSNIADITVESGEQPKADRDWHGQLLAMVRGRECKGVIVAIRDRLTRSVNGLC